MREPTSDSPQDAFNENENESLTPPWVELDGNMESASPVEAAPELTAQELEISEPFIGRWNKLVSTTNWEKGQIISEWRSEIIETARNFGNSGDIETRTDEAWSRLVGDVSPQHVGRLRRVFGRFGDTQTDYSGLYWSHFLAAMEWDDAEMWLEGALREKWSIKQMQSKRFETITATRMASGDITHDTISREESVLEKEPTATREKTKYDDEYSSDSDGSASGSDGQSHQGPSHEGPDFGEEAKKPTSPTTDPLMSGEWADVAGSGSADLGPPLTWKNVPADLAESMEAVKLAIIKHKLKEWADVSLDAVLNNLEILARIAKAS